MHAPNARSFTLCRREAGAALAAGLILSSLGTADAVAQTLALPAAHRDVDVPSRGLALPGESLTGEASSLSLETNPSQLGFLRAADATWVSNVWDKDSALPGRGHGFFFGAPLGPLGLGADLMDVQSLRTGAAHRWRFSLGAGLALGDHLALGASWHRIFDHAGGNFSAYDLGASLRLANPLAVAVTLEDLNRPGASPLPRRWTGELLLRPLSSRTLEIGAGFRKNGGDTWSAGTPRFVLRWSLPRALSFFATAELPLRDAPPGATARERDVLLAAGVTFATESLRLRVAGLDAEVSEAARAEAPGRWGGSYVLGISGVHAPSLGAEVARLDAHELGSERTFLGFVTNLERIAADPAIVAVYLRVRDLELGLGRIEELRERLRSLRERGKRVFVHLNSAGKKEMYLALAADRVFLHPLGQVMLGGLSANRLWWKSAMDKLGVRGEMVRMAEYKGAMEPFVYDAETEAVRANVQSIVNDDYRRLVAAFATDRPGTVRDLSASEALLARGLLLPEEAKKAGLIDEILDEREGEDAVKAALGHPHLRVRTWRTRTEEPSRWFGPRVAVVLVEGAIADQDPEGLPFGRGKTTSADSVVKALEGLENDPSVRAVLVRVNSGGGSAFASERMMRALLRLKKKGRPIVISFGDIAASGGYYVATAGDLVFAEPSTLTGSIGVFAFKVDASALMGRLGVFEERASQGVPSEPFSPYHAWTPEEKRGVEASIENIYRTFLTHVVEARAKKGLDTTEKVDAIARGHVWTGAQAFGVGLVDHRGDFLRALFAAAALGRVPTDDRGLPRMRIIPTEDWRQQLLARAGADLLAGAKLALAGGPAALGGASAREGAFDDGFDGEGADDDRENGLSVPSASATLLFTAWRALVSPWVGLTGKSGAGVQAALPYALTVE